MLTARREAGEPQRVPARQKCIALAIGALALAPAEAAKRAIAIVPAREVERWAGGAMALASASSSATGPPVEDLPDVAMVPVANSTATGLPTENLAGVATGPPVEDLTGVAMAPASASSSAPRPVAGD